jgi:hypothetical protein
MELTKAQQQAIINAHLSDTLLKDTDLIKEKLFDKTGKITALGESTARKIAQERHKKIWA